MNKEEKFNAIIEDNSDRIHRICRYYHSNSEDQKDLYQEILVNIWKSLDNFRGDAKLSTWVYRVAVNTSLTFLGQTVRKMKLFVDAETMNLGAILTEDNLTEKLQIEDQINRLQLELNQLTIIDKALISLLLEGLSMKEIADVVGITESNVKVKIHRIKAQIKENLKVERHEKQ